MSSEAHADPRSFRSNLQALRTAQKPSRGTAAYGRLVNRPAGRLVAAATHRFGLTPDGATAISATLSALGLVVLATFEPSPAVAIAVPVLLAAGYVMDSVDGQLARLRGRGSVRGEWLDHTVDCFKTSALHLAVAISWFRFPPTDDRAILLIPLGFSVVQSVLYFGLIIMPLLRERAGRTRAADPMPPSLPPENPLRQWLILPTDYGFLVWTFLLLDWATVFVTVYTAMFLITAAMLVLALRKWWRELSAIDSAGA